jgi:hypothetical protein
VRVRATPGAQLTAMTIRFSSARKERNIRAKSIFESEVSPKQIALFTGENVENCVRSTAQL